MDNLAGIDFVDVIRSLPSSDRGRKMALRATPSPRTIDFAAHLVDALDFDDIIEGHLRDDLPGRAAKVGRPENISPRAYLIAMMASPSRGCRSL